ncbi:WxL protein peptidoglycan domain-containing protein [Actinokineospora enzanensis]|uniref:WxL protein peptidoglycan domain-containing protein n=1 Tax=Actinokineospora enzanensis TaxID=155975 RepID=UPI00037CCE69|nr:DUF916 domain-containing protein [Actinokineospora enzanensis]
MSRIWRHPVLLALTAALTLVLAPASAHAAAPATYGVRPATATAPDTRPNFSYSATPGAIISDFVAVSNLSTDPLTLKLYANDAYNTPDGGFDLLPGNRAATDVGSWTRLEVPEVTVPGRDLRIVPFKLTIPAGATPGDHVGGIVVALVTEATDANGQKVAVEQRVGARIYLRVSGDLAPRLAIDELTADYSGSFVGSGETTIDYTVRNIGNVRLGGRQRVTVETPWGSGTSADNLKDLPELLPGNSIRQHVVIPGVLPAGWLDGLVHIEPVAPPGPQPQAQTVEASVTVLAVPWLVLIILLLVVALTVFLLWRRRRRKRGADPTPSQPETEPEVANASA